MSKKLKKIVCIGGGTGVSVILSGFKKEKSVSLSAIVSVFDTGGSSGEITRAVDILPLGDIRNSLVHSSTINKALAEVFQYRFRKFKKLKGHSIGNLLLLAMAEEDNNDVGKAIQNLKKLLQIENREIIPVSLKKSDIKVKLKNGEEIIGEEKIVNCKFLSKVGIEKLSLIPKVKANKDAILEIKKANLIILAPGKFFTSILPNLLVEGVSEAIRKSKAKKVFICNLMTQPGNTDDFKVGDFVRILEDYLGNNVIDYVIFNTGRLSRRLIKNIQKIFPRTNLVDYGENLLSKNKFIGQDLLDRRIGKLNPSDILVKGANQRAIIFHDSKKLAKILIKICK
ncbi:MAG: gluconeogenesis factor YvcK family protein [Patescibacteria group bacterium]